MASLKTCIRCDVDLVLGKNWRESAQKKKIYYCTPCKNNINQEYRDRRGPEYARKINLEKRYGITLEQFDEMLEAQGGGCKMCGWNPPQGKNLCVDHCHESKEIRGLLCLSCNHVLGHARDNKAVLLSGIAYLEQTNSAKEGDAVWHPNPLVTEDPEAFFTIGEVLDVLELSSQGEDLI